MYSIIKQNIKTLASALAIGLTALVFSPPTEAQFLNKLTKGLEKINKGLEKVENTVRS